MNIKMKSIVSVLALTAATFAADAPAPTAVRDGAALAPDVVPVEESASAVTEAPVENVSEPVAEASADAGEIAAPAAVRNGESVVPENTPVAVEPVENNAEPVQVVAPTAVRTYKTTVRTVDPDTLAPAAVYYKTTYVPVKTVYVGETSGQDSITLDELRGLVPQNFGLAVQGFVGSYMLTDYNYYDEAFMDFTWRVGLSAFLPLNKFTIGMKLGVLFEQSEASSTVVYYDRDTKSESRVQMKFEQRKIDIPLMFSFKAPSSRVMFDFGAQASVPLQDEFTSKTKDGKSSKEIKLDMIDEDYRKSVDWSLVFGLEFRAHKYVSLVFRYDLGLNDIYESYNEGVVKLDDLTSNAFLIGVSFYFL